MPRALLSVSDKSGLIPFAQGLAARGYELASTGGTARALEAAGVAVTAISAVTGFPEIMDGRVKTLHPAVHGGILARRARTDDMATLEQHNITAIDVVVVNLYPFVETAARPGIAFGDLVEEIDIGGPSMVRSAAKNFQDVLVVVDPGDYPRVLTALDATGSASIAFRFDLARKAFAHTAAYDAAIAGTLAEFTADAGRFTRTETTPVTPQNLSLTLHRIKELRYGENPHQRASLYLPMGPSTPGVAQARQVQGKELSYNNLNDANAALELAAEFRDGPPTVVIVKHANPCGVASADRLVDAWREALACDSVSAFGGIVAVNRPLDEETATAIGEIFTEVVVAPEASEGARAVFARKKNLRLLLAGALPDPARKGQTVTVIAGGVLVQDRDHGMLAPDMLKLVTRREPTERELADCLFAWTVAKHVKSNAIVYAKDGVTAGIGAGQMNRRDSARIAAIKAREAAETHGWPEPRTVGSAVASDAFFPFADGLLAAADAGATAVIQPGGSIRDDEVIAAADEAGLAMLFTGMRHFRH